MAIQAWTLYLAERLVYDCQAAVLCLRGSERGPVWLQQGVAREAKNAQNI